jgi:hypothetical protein
LIFKKYPYYVSCEYRKTQHIVSISYFSPTMTSFQPALLPECIEDVLLPETLHMYSSRLTQEVTTEVTHIIDPQAQLLFSPEEIGFNVPVVCEPTPALSFALQEEIAA